MTFSNDSVYFAGFTISPRITSSMDGSVCSVVGSLSLSLSTRSKANAEVGVAIKTVVVSDYATHWLDSSGTEWAKAADGGARFRQVGSKFDWCCEAAKPRDAVALREAAKPGDCRWRCEKPRSYENAGGAARSYETVALRDFGALFALFGNWHLPWWHCERGLAHCGALWRTVAHCGALGALRRTLAHCGALGALWHTVAQLWRTVAHCLTPPSFLPPYYVNTTILFYYFSNNT